jgi:hypothetical protein
VKTNEAIGVLGAGAGVYGLFSGKALPGFRIFGNFPRNRQLWVKQARPDHRRI